MTYHHLSQEERYQISALLKAGLTQAQISLILGRHKSTICNDDVDGLSSAASSAKVWSQERHGEGDRP
jgi:hypothetical protein